MWELLKIRGDTRDLTGRIGSSMDSGAPCYGFCATCPHLKIMSLVASGGGVDRDNMRRM